MDENHIIFYIRKIRKATVAAAAQELGVTRQHLYLVAKGICSKKLARKIEVWSNGYIKAARILGV